jgi:hypothetical protein
MCYLSLRFSYRIEVWHKFRTTFIASQRSLLAVKLGAVIPPTMDPRTAKFTVTQFYFQQRVVNRVLKFFMNIRFCTGTHLDTRRARFIIAPCCTRMPLLAQLSHCVLLATLDYTYCLTGHWFTLVSQNLDFAVIFLFQLLLLGMGERKK